MTRLFVAAWPPPDVIDQLRDLTAVEPVDGERRVAEENWHVTLRYLGNADPDEVIRRLEGTTLPSVRAHLGPEVIRFHVGQIVIPVTGVDSLADAIRATTADLGEPPNPEFRGHLTLARVKNDASSELLRETIDAAFEIEEVRLVASTTKADGPVYETLATLRTK